VFLIQYESFENLDETKKMNIINAGFKVFAEHGYVKASVEEIVKAAGISKGSLFYYFESKKNFLTYLYNYSGQVLERIVDSPGSDGKPTYMVYTDFFERLNTIQLLKMKAATEYPHMTHFLKKIVLDSSPVVKETLTAINEKYMAERVMSFFQGLDYHKFKDGIEPMMVIQLLTWCSEGCASQVQFEEKMRSASQKTAADFDRVVELYEKYVALFRNNFYKAEYL